MDADHPHNKNPNETYAHQDEQQLKQFQIPGCMKHGQKKKNFMEYDPPPEPEEQKPGDLCQLQNFTYMTQYDHRSYMFSRVIRSDKIKRIGLPNTINESKRGATQTVTAPSRASRM